MSDTSPATSFAGPEVGAATAIRLVASREILIRLRSKAFNVLTIVMVLLIGGGVLGYKLISESGGMETRVAVLEEDSAGLSQLDAIGPAVGGAIRTHTVENTDAGIEQVRDGQVDALLTIEDGTTVVVTVETDVSPVLEMAATALAQALMLDQEITKLGGDAATVGSAVMDAQPRIDTLSVPVEYDLAALVVGSIAGILIFMTLQFGGQYVALGVVEEKSSRVVELLLAAIKPWQLMVGKVAGIGLLGLGQMVLYGGTGLGLAIGFDVIDFSVAAAASTLAWLVIWYILGFVLYAFAFAAAAALVSRQEDATGVMMPILLFVIIAYVVGISVLPSNPSSKFVEVMSLLPPFAPILMPMRLAMGEVPPWQTSLSLVLTVALIPVMALLTARIYRNAVIHIGARVSLRRALAGN